MKKTYGFIAAIAASAMISICSHTVSAREPAPVRYDAFDGGRIGARAQGMGFAFTAVADNADAPFWNAAGLYNLSGNLFTVSLDTVRNSRLSTDEIIAGEPLKGRTLTYLAFAGPKGAIGFRPMADIEETIILDPLSPETDFEQRQVKINSFFIAASSEYTDDMTMGLSIHYLNGRLGLLRRRTGSEPYLLIDDGNGYSLDWSFLYHPTPELDLGLNVQNLPGSIFWSELERTLLPVILRTGCALSFTGMMTIAYDYEKRFYRDHADRPSIHHVGLEQWLGPLLRLRGGVFSEDLHDAEKTHYTAGLGYARNKYLVDIAMEKYTQSKSGSLERIFDYLVSISIPFASAD